MIIPVLGIPYYNRPDLLRRCIDSIDTAVQHLVIIDNSPDSLSWEIAVSVESFATQITIIRHPNAGVAGRWNEIIKLFPAPWWMLVNNDIAFARGDLDCMAAFVDKHPELAACYGNHGASWWAVTHLGVQQVGLFDENFYPAYLEDCDWSRRADLAGAVRQNVPFVQAIHGDVERGETGSCTIMADPAVRAENHRTHGLNFEYYRAKWGGNNGEETYRTPFNRPGYPIQAWTFNPAIRWNNTWRISA